MSIYRGKDGSALIDGPDGEQVEVGIHQWEVRLRVEAQALAVCSAFPPSANAYRLKEVFPGIGSCEVHVLAWWDDEEHPFTRPHNWYARSICAFILRPDRDVAHHSFEGRGYVTDLAYRAAVRGALAYEFTIQAYRLDFE